MPEGKRFCPKCDAALKRETGYCGRCGAKYSFVASLRSGDLVANQYQVKGPMAYGGLGWIYLAYDTFLCRYVVLKGLLNLQNEAAATAALTERLFLAALKHPNIVTIHNFVQTADEGFIVMEYVGGKTLKHIRQDRGPLPPAEAIAYVLRLLPALSYLHEQGLLFCDLKPENIMLERDEIKLIDLGGVRRIEDRHADIYGTVGYSAPEAGAGPTVASDLFTVGRTLAVLLMNIPGFNQQNRYAIPTPEQAPLLTKHDSLHRFLVKATAEFPERRFLSAREMSEQLLGVWHEVVALETGAVSRRASALFGPHLIRFRPNSGTQASLPGLGSLPLPAIDSGDSAASEVARALALRQPEERIAALRAACKREPTSREASLRLAAVLGQHGQYTEAEERLCACAEQEGQDWRVPWLRGCLGLMSGCAEQASQFFDQVYSEIPGELAPKLALAFCAESAGEVAASIRMYDLVSRVDPDCAAANYGLARCYLRQQNQRAAAESLLRVPPSSGQYTKARMEAVNVLLATDGDLPSLEAVVSAGDVAQGLALDPLSKLEVQRRLLRAAITYSRTLKRGRRPEATLLGLPMAERPLRRGLEQTLRSMAEMKSGRERTKLLDEANLARPRTLF